MRRGARATVRGVKRAGGAPLPDVSSSSFSTSNIEANDFSRSFSRRRSFSSPDPKNERVRERCVCGRTEPRRGMRRPPGEPNAGECGESRHAATEEGGEQEVEDYARDVEDQHTRQEECQRAGNGCPTVRVVSRLRAQDIATTIKEGKTPFFRQFLKTQHTFRSMHSISPTRRTWVAGVTPAAVIIVVVVVVGAIVASGGRAEARRGSIRGDRGMCLTLKDEVESPWPVWCMEVCTLRLSGER